MGAWFAPTYKTTNGGNNWFLDAFGENVNRLRFINDTVAYAVGRRVYKYSTDSLVNITPISITTPAAFKLDQNYPNPFNPRTKIRFDIVLPAAEIRLSVFNSLGQEIETLVDGKLEAGSYEVEFKAGSHPSGVYYYKLITYDHTDVKKMVLVK